MVLVIGAISYLNLPRSQFPDINLYWIEIQTIAPGMSASDVESRVTVVLERAVRNIEDLSFSTSFSRENISAITLRFDSDISEEKFDKLSLKVRREVQRIRRELPDEVDDPFIIELNTSVGFPIATVAISSESDDINLLEQAQSIEKDLKAIGGIDLIMASGLHPRELQVRLDSEKLENLGVASTEVADTVATYYRDFAAGTNRVGAQSWSVKIDGMRPDPEYLANLPLLQRSNEINIGDVSTVIYDHEEPEFIVRLNDKPAVMFEITKQRDANSLIITDAVREYIEQKNLSSDSTGVTVSMVDDQSNSTRTAIKTMQRNASLGLLLVLIMTWLFLGPRIAVYTCIGIPFIIAGVFWIIANMGFTLNVIVLLGIVISLGMIVDDAVVVIESIYYRLQLGMNRMDASIAALQEVAAPVTTAVFTTIAAFMPLVLLQGVMGQFMKIVPWVVTLALLMSLVEAFWMLPVHIGTTKKGYDHNNKMNRWRRRWQRKLRNRYTRILVWVVKRPALIIGTNLFLIVLALSSSFAGIQYPQLNEHPIAKHFVIKFDFFASDTFPLFYINVEMPSGTPLESTMASVDALKKKVESALDPNELNSVVAYAGKMQSDTAPLFGQRYGQILVSLKKDLRHYRNADVISKELRELLDAHTNAQRVSVLLVQMAPPVGKPLSLKVMGDDINDLRVAKDAINEILAANENIIDVVDDDNAGGQELAIQMNTDSINRAGLDPLYVARNIRMMVDGEIVATMQHKGEELNVRVLPDNDNLNEIDELLDANIPTPSGAVSIRSLTDVNRAPGLSSIRRHNFRRSITIEADIISAKTDTVNANKYVLAEWKKIQLQHPGISISNEGQLDDINESLNSLGTLFLLGLLLMYIIIGTQFQSYFQPFMIIITVPLALIGVVIGQLISGNSVSMYTMFGVVALAGMAVNAAIVMISAANDRLRRGMSVTHAAIYAGRRRVMPIIITSFTTMAGLFSLAAGIGGKSLMWSPLANAIVWGIMISSTLTLLLIPVIYMIFMPYSNVNKKNEATALSQLRNFSRRKARTS